MSVTTSCASCVDIDITGIGNAADFNINASAFWTQTSIQESLFIPSVKPDIEELDSLSISVNVIRTRLVNTPVGESLEGQILTGKKLIIEGELCQAVTYTGDVPEQSLHTAHFTVPFSAYIVVDGSFTEKVHFQINALIEDVCISQISSREIYKCVTLFLQAIPTPLPTAVC